VRSRGRKTDEGWESDRRNEKCEKEVGKKNKV